MRTCDYNIDITETAEKILTEQPQPNLIKQLRKFMADTGSIYAIIDARGPFLMITFPWTQPKPVSPTTGRMVA